MTANLGHSLRHVPRMVRPELAGGALLDLGVYAITSALMLFHEEVTDVASTAVFLPSGVDQMNNITLTFTDGKMAVLYSNMSARTDCGAVVSGDEGYMEIQEINNPKDILIYDKEGNFKERIPVPEQINGYEYEVLACVRAIEAGEIECPEMPHSETLRVMRLMDQIRAQWGFTLPCEEV